jgi:hypothetical protein
LVAFAGVSDLWSRLRFQISVRTNDLGLVSTASHQPLHAPSSLTGVDVVAVSVARRFVALVRYQLIAFLAFALFRYFAANLAHADLGFEEALRRS